MSTKQQGMLPSVGFSASRRDVSSETECVSLVDVTLTAEGVSLATLELSLVIVGVTLLVSATGTSFGLLGVGAEAKLAADLAGVLPACFRVDCLIAVAVEGDLIDLAEPVVAAFFFGAAASSSTFS